MSRGKIMLEFEGSVLAILPTLPSSLICLFASAFQ